jgi:DNA helicase-2/ATP-dependent DNA helicase PcrA
MPTMGWYRRREKRRHPEGLQWDDMAVLYRSNFVSRGFEEALMRTRIPYTLIGDVGFYQRSEIKDALALLRIAVCPDDRQSDEAFRRVINFPARGFGPKALNVLESEAAWRQVSLRAALETASLPPRSRAAGLRFADVVRAVGRDQQATLADQISLLLDGTGYRNMMRDSRTETTKGRLENIQELVLLAGGFHTALELLDHAALAKNGQGEEGHVRLMTLHKGKGLEFHHEFLPGWELNSFPPPYGELAEERRLAYVALTRGMLRVTISHCGYRRGYGEPSPFIGDIPEAHRVMGWLRAQSKQADRRPVPCTLADAINEMELLKRV